MLFDSLAIVGVGLIGGSIGLAAKARRSVRRVIGIGRSDDQLRRAQSLGAIDEWSLDLAVGVARADVVVFCSPVDVIAKQTIEASKSAPPGCLFTDAGSTKATIVRDLDAQLPAAVRFVGAHPLAGSEKQGVQHARSDLFQDRICVVTPTERTTPSDLDRATAFWTSLGSVVKLMRPDEHDVALASTSHLPHFVAAILASELPEKWRSLAATGFRDVTRIASGDPLLWAAIARENAMALRKAIDSFGDRLGRFREALLTDDSTTIVRLLTEGKRVRDALGS